MPNTPGSVSSPPLRLWPGVAAAMLFLVFRFVLPGILPEAMLVGLAGGAVCALGIFAWWIFFSRAPWTERLGAVAVSVLALALTLRFIHASIENGMMGMMFLVHAIPTLSLALVLWAVASRRFATGPRRAAMVATLVLASGAWTLVRTDGVTSDVIGSDFHWRWTPTAEEVLLARTANEPALPAPPPAPISSTPVPVAVETGKVPTAPVAAPASEPAPEPESGARTLWPGFRGPERDGTVRGVRIETDWSASPPVELWRRPIGPGWSSFAVDGDLLYTQEQRGDDEIVACYRVSTGEPVWRHRDPVRFWESNGGAGPRGTPTLNGGRVYAFGATGMLNALDAATGRVVWSQNAATDTGRTVPDWGFASSPLIVDDAVIIAVSGTLAAYDRNTGHPRWVGPQHGGTYSSPQLVTIDGVRQILLLSPPGVVSLAPADGALLWEHTWDGGAIVQPAVTASGDIVINSISATGGSGTRRLAVLRRAGEWRAEERWTSNGLKPYFNDFVIHAGHAYGFDGSILACIDLEDGKRVWKGGRYGNGQLVLLADQDLLLVLSEDGELALVGASPDRFTEVARFTAIDGKTWNHPVLVGDVLLVRNGQEMAAFRLAIERR